MFFQKQTYKNLFTDCKAVWVIRTQPNFTMDLIVSSPTSLKTIASLYAKSLIESLPVGTFQISEDMIIKTISRITVWEDLILVKEVASTD